MYVLLKSTGGVLEILAFRITRIGVCAIICIFGYRLDLMLVYRIMGVGMSTGRCNEWWRVDRCITSSLDNEFASKRGKEEFPSYP